MAGIRHHILPRFLLKGFASKISGKEISTWVYREKGKIFEANIVNVGVEKHFYGKEDRENVDDEITDIEQGFAVLLNELRKENNGYKITNPQIAEFICHLSIRTKHLRDSLIESTGILTTILTNYLADADNFKTWILEYYKRHPEVLKKGIDDALKKLKIPKQQKFLVRRQLQAMVNPNQIVNLMQNDIPQYASMFGVLSAEFIGKIPTIAKESHIKALAKDLTPEPRVEDYRRLSWYVVKTSHPLILGDVGCLFEIENKTKFVSLNNKEDILKNTFLPIATDVLIIGTSASSLPQIDIKGLNEKIVKSSKEFFICGENSEELKILHRHLGEDAEIFSKTEIAQIVKEVIEEG